MLSRRQFLRAAAGTAAAAAGGILEACSRGAKRKTLNFFNWFNYIGKETLSRFERETGVSVRYEVYSSEEEMFSKLKAGVHGYDLIVATDHLIPRFKALNLIDRIPRDALKNLDNISPRLRDPAYDPGLAFTVPYLWGTTGIGFSRERLPAVPLSWWDLWNERHRGRISMLDNVRDVIGTALRMLGLPADAKKPEHLRSARDLLLRQRPLLKHYTSTTYVDDLASGELCLAQAWSGDVLQASREFKQVDYAVPKEGSFIYVDSLCVIRGSENRAQTLEFIDYLLRPEVAAEIAETVRYASPNAKALALLDPALRLDPRVFPSPETERRLNFHAPLDPDAEVLWNRTWQEVRAL